MTTVASLNTAITGDPSALINALNASTRAVTQFGNSVTQMNARVSTSAFSIGRLLAAVGVGISVRSVVDYADAWTLAEGRIRLVTQSTAELQRVTRALFTTAQDTRQSFDATADLYGRVARNAKQLGVSQNDIIRITRAVGQSMRISSAGIQESRAAMIQLGQALSSGRLQGDELRSILENAPRLAQAIADSLGVTVGQLRKMGTEGVLTSQAIAKAILDASGQLELEAAKLPTTIGQSLTQLSNSIKRFIGETDRSLGATTKLVGLINTLGDQFDNNRAAVETFAFVLGAGVLVKSINLAIAALGRLAAGTALAGLLSLLPAVKSLRDAFAFLQLAIGAAWRTLLGPIGLVVTAIGIAAAVFFKWRKGIDEARKAGDALRESFEKLDPKELTTRIDKSLEDLTRMNHEAATLRANVEAAARAGGIAPGDSERLRELEPQIERTRKTLQALIDVRNAAGAVAPPPVRTQDEDALKKFADSTQRVIETFKIMQAQGEHTHRVVARLRELFDETQKKLRGLADPFGEEALRLRKILADLADLPEIKLRLRIDTSTREIRQMAEAEVNKLTEALTAKDSGLIPRVTVQPIIDTSLATRSMQTLAQRLPADMANAIGRIRFDTLRDRLASQLGAIPITFEPVGLDRFQKAVDLAIAAQNRLNLARAGGDQQAIISAEQAYAAAVDNVRNALGALARNLDGANVKAEDQAKAIEAINEAAGKLQITLTGAVSRLDKFLNFARAATGIGRAVLGIADAMRSVDENIRRAISSAVGFTDALADLAQAQKELRAGTGSPITVAASALGATGAGLSLVNSVVTAIQADNEKLRQVIREQTEIQRENNRALERLRLDVGGFTGSIGDLRRAMSAIRLPSQAPGAPSMIELIRQIGEWERSGTGPSTRNALEGALKAAGSSLAELQAAAELVGIELFDSAGRLIPDAFALLDDAIELHIRSVTEWRRTLDDTRSRMELEANVFDFPATAQRSIEQGIAQLRTLAPAIFEKFFAGVDLEDAVQVEAALRLLTRTLLDNIGTLAGDFDALFGRDELIQVIELVESGLDGLAGAANTVTASLLNVPQGFRLERARFEATLGRTMDSLEKGVKNVDFTKALIPPKVPLFSDVDLAKEVKGGNDRLLRAVLDQTLAEQASSARLESILSTAFTLSGREAFEAIESGAGTLSIGGGTVIILEGDILIDGRDKTGDELLSSVTTALKNKARQHGLSRRPSEMLDLS